MRYLVLTERSTEYAEAISALMWAVTRPPAVRDARDRTGLYCAHSVADDGRVALLLPDAETVPVHPDADGRALADQIAHALAPGEADTLAAAIDGARGTRVDPLDLVPESARSRLHNGPPDDWTATPTEAP